MDKENIIKELKNHIADRGGEYSDWYTGIAENPKERLDQHNVNRDKGGDWWAHRISDSKEIAEEIEDYFVNTLGTAGAPGGGTDATKSVYIYKKSTNTKP